MASVSPAVAKSAAQSHATNPESFAALFEESLTRKEMRVGEVITAEVLRVDQNFVVVNAGLKSESVIALEEFRNDSGEIDVKAGDFVSVSIEALEDGYGETRLSREKAKRMAAWLELEKALETGEKVQGTITGKVKGGLTVMAKGIRAFLPGSLVDLRPVKDTTPFEGKTMEFKVIKLDRKRNNVVVSRRAVLEETAGAEREQLLSTLSEGAVVKGIVKNITDYGAFVDLGGIDGLLHITDLAWRRVKHPSEVVNVGDEVTAKVLKFDAEKNRVSLGLKQLGEDPWVGISRRYPQSTRLFGKVTNLTDYGAFVEVEAGIEGLVHVSEMDWTNKNVHPSKVVQVGDEVEVMILEIDEERRRISLGMKQCMPNPWEDFAREFKKGDRVKGQIKSITDFGGGQELQEGRRGRDRGAVDRRRARAHLARHQAARGRPVHQLHRQPREEQRRPGQGEVGRRQGRGDRAHARDRGLPESVGVLARPDRGPAHGAQGGRRGDRDDHQRRPQEPRHQHLGEGQGCGRGDRGDEAAAHRERGQRRGQHQPRRPAAREARQERIGQHAVDGTS
jgi:ribosomal protein S1